jgi:NAD(P)-dependent dehydrogenase (short-subunit alcohol dehydrogenase family)
MRRPAVFHRERRGSGQRYARRTNNPRVTEIENEGGTATALVADVADPAQVRAVADRALQVYGRLDTWVHMAGVLLVAGFEDTTAEEFARVLQVNLLGQVHGAKAAAAAAPRWRGVHLHVVDGLPTGHSAAERLLLVQARH